MKKIIYTLIFLLVTFFSANAQWIKGSEKLKNLEMPRMSQISNSALKNNNEFWKEINVPSIANSYVPEVETPTATAVWAKIGFDSIGNDTRYFLRSGNSGGSWRLDTINAPAGYVIANLAPIDGDTCYAIMINGAVDNGGGIFKTTNGGRKWRQLAVGQVYNSTSFPDFIYFFDAKHGVAVGDGNLPGPPYYLEIYTTNDYGATWQRVPPENIPAPNGFPYSTDFNAYSAVGDRIWFRGFDSNGGQFLYRSDDRGQHWQSFPLSVKRLFDFDFSDSLHGLSTGFDNNGKVYINYTHDGGITWKKVDYSGSPREGFIVNVPGTSTFVSTIPGSSYSNDFGKTWISIDSGANANHTALNFFSSSIGWSGEDVGLDSTGGMFKWKGSFSTPSLAGNSEDKLITANKQIAMTNSIFLYPNPTKNVLTVNGLSSSNTKISVIDVSGRLIQQIKTTGKNYTMNLEKLTPGNYFLKIESSDNKSSTLKFIKE